MWFSSEIEVTCESCGLTFKVPRAPQGTPCTCADCEAVNLVPAPPPVRWGRATLVVVVAALIAAAGYGLWNWNLERGGGQALDLRSAADQEFRAKNYARALELFEELAVQEPPTARERFQLVQILAALGRRKEARQVAGEILDLAGTDWLPHTSQVYSDLHFWLAQEIYSRPHVTSFQWRAAEDHLRVVLQFSPQHETARRMLLAMLQAEGKQLEALPHLEKLAGHSTSDRMALAIAFAQVGKGVRAAEEAELVLASLLVDLSESPGDIDLRRQAARAAILVGDFGIAEQQLKLALHYSDRDPQTVAQLAEVYEIQAARLSREHPDWARRSLELVRNSLDLAPRRLRTYDALKPLLLQPDGVGAEAQSLLMTAIARGGEPARLHGLLAESASRAGRPAESILHWRAAVASQPDWEGPLNNLAWELCWSEPPELDDALRFIDRALRLAPGSPALRETRGQILARAGRTREALPDLLSAVARFSNNARLHATLAEVYHDLDHPEEAALHAKRAEELAPETRFAPVRVSKKDEEGEGRR